MRTKNINTPLLKKMSWLIIFSIAMAYLETAVVVYLREIYYPQGFTFPLTPIHSKIAFVEFWREVATIVMLAGISLLTGKSSSERFGFFLLAFAIWDIFYYVFLYLLLSWPSSLFTWDILFLVPVPWVGPVITPVIVALLMILFALKLIYFKAHLNYKEWTLSIIGSAIIIFSWVLDYWNFSSTNNSGGSWTLSSSHELFSSTVEYIPNSFNWYIFLTGVLFLVITLLLFYLRNTKTNKND